MKTAKAEGLNHWTTDQGPPQKYVNLFFFVLLYRSGRCGMPRPRETSSGRTSPTGQPGQHKIWSCSLKIPLTKRGQGLSRIKYKLTLGDREGWGWVGGSGGNNGVTGCFSGRVSDPKCGDFIRFRKKPGITN